MVIIEDDIASEFDNQPRFSTIKKNFGNKLSIYALSRIIAEELNYSLIVPDKALIGRNLTFPSKYVPMQYYQEFFPFKGFIGYNIDYPECFIDDNVLYNYGSVEELIKNCKGNKVISAGYYSKYDYLKPYKERIKTFYKDIISGNKREGIVLLLRNSRNDPRFVLPDNYYLDILEKLDTKNVYVCVDHLDRHERLLNKIKQDYSISFIDGSILEVFKEITSFDTIIACQGTFSFWVSWLSHATKIYWPMTNDGPNSNNDIFKKHVNLKVDDESRYEMVTVKNIYGYE